MNWLYYLAEANLYLCVFYVAYCIFLVKETHYQLNRAYLLLSCFVAFALPVIQIGALKPSIALTTTAVLPNLIDQPMQYMAPTQTVTTLGATASPELNFTDYLWLAYIAGAVILLLMLALKLYSVFKLTRCNKSKYGSYKMVYLDDTDVAFSFFNYLFIGTRATGATTIITHELVHIRQKHSADIMFLEMLKVICWFNPCIYLLQSSLKTIHEYIADEQTAASEMDAITYSSFLVNNAYGAGGSSITHSFFNYNLLKKRIIMLNQQRSGKLARLKYLMALPICAAMLCASTLSFSKTYVWVNLGPANKPTNTTASFKELAPFTDTLTTSKGYKYTQIVYNKNGITTCNVTFYESDGTKTLFSSAPMSHGKITLLNDKYGYQFPKAVFPPEPPKPKGDLVRFPKKRTHGHDVVKFPPPAVNGQNVKFNKVPPPEPPKPKIDVVKFPPPAKGDLKTSATGYQYEETGYLVGKKENYRVIIHESNGEEIEFYKNSATKQQLKLLKDKYGYTFPTMKIHDRLPPPPPMPPAAKPNQKNTGVQLGQKKITVDW